MIRQFPEAHDPHDGSPEHSPLVKLWYGLLADSLKRDAERIHVLPPGPNGTFPVRVYGNGAWEQSIDWPAAIYPAFLQRLKVMAGFSLAKRVPVEQGRFRFAAQSGVYEIAVTVRSGADGVDEAMVDLPAGTSANPSEAAT